MINAYVNMFKNYINIKDKTKRKEFWLAILMNIIVSILFVNIINLIINSSQIQNYIIYIYTVITLIPRITLKVRRLHDIGKSGWLELLELIPILGSLIIYIMCILPSENK